jgi:hypothetical protein
VTDELRPATLSRELLAALEASEGRRKRRRRDTTADALGMAIKRALLDAAVHDDPGPEAFEAWLLDHVLAAPPDISAGAVRAMAIELLSEWRLASASTAFRSWLDQGSPSDDRSDA